MADSITDLLNVAFMGGKGSQHGSVNCEIVNNYYLYSLSLNFQCSGLLHHGCQSFP